MKTAEQYINETAELFIENHTLHNEMIDVTGMYGPQATDLVIEYVRALTGVRWGAPTQHARDWLTLQGIRNWFDEVQPHELRYGDIVVMHGFDTSDFGTVGIYVDHVHVRDQSFGTRRSDDMTALEVFCQTPHKPGTVRLDYLSTLGGWRYRFATPISQTLPSERNTTHGLWTPQSGEPHPLREIFLKDTPGEKRAVLGEFMVNTQSEKTAGEECIEEFDKWVAQNVKRGPVMSCTFHSDCAKGIDRVNLDDVAHAGDVIVWDSHIPSMFGHVAVVRPKRAGWLRRISNWLGITREELEAVRQEPKE
ncbi:endolysin [Arthrobacter phage StevieBAY]|uniref:Endolysin n=1 Tax=Arthrobacter phage StevieBAY TaxID=2725609 RepID=A0A6M3TC61_9CAUD|nr:endolysin [Arthrobacter phage StevieBAY]